MRVDDGGKYKGKRKTEKKSAGKSGTKRGQRAASLGRGAAVEYLRATEERRGVDGLKFA